MPRRLNIGIRTRAERSKAIRHALRQTGRDNQTSTESALYFENVSGLRQILTEKRLELLLAVTRHRPSSVQELAKLLRRDYKNVSTDVTMLERLGLVKLEAKRGQGGAQALTVPYDEIRMTIDLRHSQRADLTKREE